LYITSIIEFHGEREQRSAEKQKKAQKGCSKIRLFLKAAQKCGFVFEKTFVVDVLL